MICKHCSTKLRKNNSFTWAQSKTFFIVVIVHLFDYLAAAVGLHPTKTLVSCTHKEHTVYRIILLCCAAATWPQTQPLSRAVTPPPPTEGSLDDHHTTFHAQHKLIWLHDALSVAHPLFWRTHAPNDSWNNGLKNKKINKKKYRIKFLKSILLFRVRTIILSNAQIKLEVTHVYCPYIH